MLIKILVVDDSASDRLIIKNMLSEYNVLTACDGVEALRVLSEHEGINLLIVLLYPHSDAVNRSNIRYTSDDNVKVNVSFIDLRNADESFTDLITDLLKIINEVVTI
jgi:CheY-like chemotaxis protein